MSYHCLCPMGEATATIYSWFMNLKCLFFALVQSLCSFYWCGATYLIHCVLMVHVCRWDLVILHVRYAQSCLIGWSLVFDWLKLTVFDWLMLILCLIVWCYYCVWLVEADIVFDWLTLTLCSITSDYCEFVYTKPPAIF